MPWRSKPDLLPDQIQNAQLNLISDKQEIIFSINMSQILNVGHLKSAPSPIFV